MQLERRALYNLLRMNWLRDRELGVEPWQVADYRSLSLEELLEGAGVGEEQFSALAEECDSPEELTGALVTGESTPQEEDRRYLHLFELWRRLCPEKRPLSIFFDELDQLITDYDQGDEADPSAIEDALSYLQELLEENLDQGGNPRELGGLISSYCANDLETFLYDFISEQEDDYAAELIDAFGPYMSDPRWFKLLRLRPLIHADPEAADTLLCSLVEEIGEEVDLLLETLAFVSDHGEREHFSLIVKKALPLLDTEGDLLELLDHCAHFHRASEERQMVFETLLGSRDRDLKTPLSKDDPALSKLASLVANY